MKSIFFFSCCEINLFLSIWIDFSGLWFRLWATQQWRWRHYCGKWLTLLCFPLFVSCLCGNPQSKNIDDVRIFRYFFFCWQGTRKSYKLWSFDAKRILNRKSNISLFSTKMEILFFFLFFHFRGKRTIPRRKAAQIYIVV